MDYRNERDALRGRVESLEQQLAEAKREARARAGAEDAARVAQIQAKIAEAEALILGIRAELSALGATGGPPRARSGGLRVAVVALAITAASVAALLFMRAPAGPVPVPAAVARAVAVDPKAASGDYFKDATSVPGMFEQKIGGPVRVLDLVVYPGYVIAQIQDPKKHENVDRYTLRNGAVGDGDPVRVQMKTAKDVDEAVLDLATVDFALLPGMLAEATVQLPIADGKVTHVILDASRVFQKGVQWRVYVGSARDSGYVSFDTAGHVEKVYH